MVQREGMTAAPSPARARAWSGAAGAPMASAKTFFAGTHRLVAPEETWERIAPLLPRFGVTRVADLTGLDRIGLPVAAAIRPLSRSIVVSAGKGVSLAAAKVSAAMEAIECAHAETIERPLVFASRREIAASATAPELDDLPLALGARLDEDTRLLWIEGQSTGSERLMLPYELVHAHYCAPDLPAAGTFLATTNGLSSGNCRAEAVCHGLFEVIERDALSLWSGLPRAARDACLVDPAEGVAGPLVTDTVARIRHAGFRLAVWDITSDIGVPAFHCLIVDARDPGGHPGTGTGCHPDRDVALFRALSEAAQVRAVYISGGRDDISRREYQPGHLDAFRRHFDGPPPARPRRLADILTRVAESFEDDIDWTSRRLEAAGCGPTIVVDLSRPGTGIHVVRVVVPGLEGPPEDNAAPGRRKRARRP
jgi:ribosomal protein S12 methylthiotransferase accessory factor